MRDRQTDTETDRQRGPSWRPLVTFEECVCVCVCVTVSEREWGKEWERERVHRHTLTHMHSCVCAITHKCTHAYAHTHADACTNTQRIIHNKTHFHNMALMVKWHLANWDCQQTGILQTGTEKKLANWHLAIWPVPEKVIFGAIWFLHNDHNHHLADKSMADAQRESI